MTRSTGDTTYSKDIIDGISVVKEKQGCSSCGTQHKRVEYNSKVDVTSITSITDTGEVTTQYVYDNPQNPDDYLGEVQQKTEAVGLTEAEDNLLLLYPRYEQSHACEAEGGDKGERGRLKSEPDLNEQL